MDSKTIFRFVRELSVVLNRCGSLVKSTMASFGAVLTLSGVPALYALVLPAKRCPVCTAVFLDVDQTCIIRLAVGARMVGLQDAAFEYGCKDRNLETAQ